MGFEFQERLSDSPFIETVTHGYPVGEGTTIRPAETHWHMVFVKNQGELMSFVVGPLTAAGVVPYSEGGEIEILWIKFKLGTFMPHLPVKNYLNAETILPGAAGRSFWLKNSAWQYPDHNNAETFIDRLARKDILARDPVVSAALQDHPQDISPRTLRHRFQHVTGMSQTQIRQYDRARRAEAMLREGTSILDTVFETGYFDQPHLTRSLKQWIGYTPAQLLAVNFPG